MASLWNNGVLPGVRAVLVLPILLLVGFPALAQAETRIIDYKAGVRFDVGVRGLNMLEDFTYGQRQAMLELALAASMRSLPQISDGYDWRRKGETGDIPFNEVTQAYPVTTLDVLRELRDRRCLGIFNAPIDGVGWLVNGTYQVAGIEEFQAETSGSVHLGSPTVQDMALDEGTSWLLRKYPGSADVIKIAFYVPMAGRYDLHIRNRCGYYDPGNPAARTAFWDNDNYYYRVNNEFYVTFVGDTSTISELDTADGSTYWGTCRAYHVPLNAGTNYLYIWGSADYLRVDSLRRGTFVDQLAADRVRYINHIVQNYRHNPNAPGVVCDLHGNQVTLTNGDPGNPYDDDKRIFDSIRWPGGPETRLLALGEPNPPKCEYLTVGNEPEGDVSVASYVDTFLKIRDAVKAVDPSVRVGPSVVCPFDPAGGKPYLDALKSALQARGQTMEYLDYHPYYMSIRSVWPPGQNQPNSIPGLENALRDMKWFLNNYTTYAAGYSNRFVASEYNPSYWDCAGHPSEYSSAHALGIVESVFTFAEQSRESLPNRMLAAHYWLNAVNAAPVRTTFEKLRDYMGDTLLDSYADNQRYFRMYTTRYSRGDNRCFVWGLNFSDTQPVTLEISLRNLPPVRRFYARKWEFRVPAGTTSLASFGSSLQWVGGGPQQVDTSGFSVTFDPAVITVLEIIPEADPVAPLAVNLGALDVVHAGMTSADGAAAELQDYRECLPDAELDGRTYTITTRLSIARGHPAYVKSGGELSAERILKSCRDFYKQVIESERGYWGRDEEMRQLYDDLERQFSEAPDGAPLRLGWGSGMDAVSLNLAKPPGRHPPRGMNPKYLKNVKTRRLLDGICPPGWALIRLVEC